MYLYIPRLLFRLAAILALVLFFLLTYEPARCQTPHNPAITAAPTRFSVVIQGPASAQNVLLIPGLASSRDVYAAEAKLLPAYRLHLVQIAGFAGEPAGPNASGPFLAPIVQQLHDYIATNHLAPVPVIGHSLGGLLAMMLAQSHPEDVSKLLIVDTLPFYGMVFNPSATVESLRPQAQAMYGQFIAMPADQFAASQPIFSAQLVNNPEGRHQVSAAAIASNRTVFANAMLEDLGTDLRPQLATIKTPMTLLYPYDPAQGDAAKITALYTTAYAAKPNLTLIRIDNSRHFIMYDQPAAFDQAIQAFLK